MPSKFTHEEQVMFDDVLGFDDMLIIARAVEKYTPLDAQAMERALDKFWIPAPQIGQL